MTAPDVIKVVRQDENVTDCAVASLAMLCGVTYGEALAAFPKPESVMKTGAYLAEIQAAALALGKKTRNRRRFDIQADTGILRLEDDTKYDHVVFLWAGRVIDGNGSCWLEPRKFLRRKHCKAKSLIAVIE